MLTPEGRLVFAIETMADRCPDDDGYKITASAETKEGLTLVLKSRNHYDEQSQTPVSPGIYELYDGARLLQHVSIWISNPFIQAWGNGTVFSRSRL